jgi:hypothetical protein
MHKDTQFHIYAPKEIVFVKRNIIGRSVAEMTEMFNRHFNCSITIKQMMGVLDRHKLRNGLRGKYPEFYFKRGHKPKTAMPIGSERIGGMGYVEVKTAYPDIWKSKHAIIWGKANGPVPKGHLIIFADGNKLNMKLDNLLMVSRSELLMMNRLRLISVNRDLTKVGKSIAQIKLLVNDRKRGMKKNRKLRTRSKMKTGGNNESSRCHRSE